MVPWRLLRSRNPSRKRIGIAIAQPASALRKMALAEQNQTGPMPNDELAGDYGRTIAQTAGAKSGDGEGRVQRQSRLSLGPRFSEPPETRQDGRPEGNARKENSSHGVFSVKLIRLTTGICALRTAGVGRVGVWRGGASRSLRSLLRCASPRFAGDTPAAGATAGRKGRKQTCSA